MARDVKGKVVLVTGSADGLGLAMVDHFLKNGAERAIMLDFNEKKGLQSLENIKAKYGKDRAVFFPCNVVMDLDKIYAEVTKIVTVDIVINNAGVLDEKSIRNTINVNALAVMEWTMKFFEYMRKDKGGNGGHEYTYNRTGVRVVAFCPGLTRTHMTNNPNVREEDTFNDFCVELKAEEWQDVDDIGKGMVETFQKADSGTVWLVEGGRAAEKINV
ncbi:unnamed protein product [Leptosia nina]|uniref:15-hydroxyprostaglandin dehydrogenase [NAD(+)] n=1 Tax=Leptosia nina TaxID=320188 RepID=A0AAV1JGK8_9NEOP